MMISAMSPPCVLALGDVANLPIDKSFAALLVETAFVSVLFATAVPELSRMEERLDAVAFPGLQTDDSMLHPDGINPFAETLDKAEVAETPRLIR